MTRKQIDLEPAERDPAKLRKTALILAVVMLLGGVLVMADYLRTLRAQEATGRPAFEGRLNKNFAAVGHDKRLVTIGELEGKVWLVTAVVLSQKDRTAENIAALQKAAGHFEGRDDLHFVVFTADPVRDQPGRMAAFAAELGLEDDPRWWFAAAGEEQIRGFLRTQLKLGATGFKEVDGTKILMFPDVIRVVDRHRHLRGGRFDFATALAVQEDARQMLVNDPERAARLRAEEQTEAVRLLQDKLHERIEYILNERLKDDE